MVFTADKLADAVLLWEKNIVPWLISNSSEHGLHKSRFTSEVKVGEIKGVFSTAETIATAIVAISVRDCLVEVHLDSS